MFLPHVMFMYYSRYSDYNTRFRMFFFFSSILTDVLEEGEAQEVDPQIF